ncbi:uncharacterized membrane protein YjjP (DUF1212 family) [Weissella uvarum]|uniref:threonine/serine exporter family protein n=1 Tax=Weissella uvarum TaxID=1479233 RepID=UPI001960EAC7|nr:threonine/serine exporter family protein [Weissella uvarum]MBM7617439.1 uncharacterized membrane protein YjjP (DUF1212 family) [Weissella uvarum]MCM0595676.1 threonine/serine exporter family protein [Weissella uvarum]
MIGQDRQQLLLAKTCLLASQILMENGSELSRIDDTVHYIANTYSEGNDDIQAYVTSTLIIITANDPTDEDMQPLVLVEQTSVKSINLTKIDEINRLSRSFVAHELTLKELYQELRKLRKQPMTSLTKANLGSFFLSSTLTYMAMHNVFNSLLAGIFGLLGMYGVTKLYNVLHRPFIGELIVAALITVAVRLIKLGTPLPEYNMIIIGALFPLLPGVQITTSINDIFDGNLISGPQRLLSALILTFTMVLGSLLVYTVWR